MAHSILVNPLINLAGFDRWPKEDNQTRINGSRLTAQGARKNFKSTTGKKQAKI
jgi:hypothetical protein